MSNVTASAPTTGATSGSARLTAIWILAVVLIVAGYLRVHNLGADSFWRDEASSWVEAQGSLVDIIRATAHDNYPPLHNFLLAIAMRLGGDSEWTLRLPSAILGLLSVAAIYWVGAMIGGPIVGLLAALLLALSPFAIHYSQEARPYALLLFGGLAFAGSVLSFERRPSGGWVAAVFFSGLALLYTHPYGAFTWLAIAGAASITQLRARQAADSRLLEWGLLQLAIVLAYAPWAWILFGRANVIAERGFWIPYPSFNFVVATLEQVSSGAATLILLLPAAATAFFAVSRASAAADGAAPPALRLTISSDLAMLLAWLFVPIVLGVALSMVRTPVFYDRYIIASLPPFLILASVGLSRFFTGRASAAAIGAFAVGVSLLGYFYGAPPMHEDWRSASAYIEQHLPPDGCVLLVDLGATQAVQYYDRRPFCVLYAKDMPTATATNVIAVLSGNVAALQPALGSPAWRIGRPVPFYRIQVVAMTRVSP